MKLIDKDALIAEIERLYQEHSSKEYIDEGGVVLEQLEDFLDSIEVKEDYLLTEKIIERELAEAYINIFDKKFGNKLPKLKGTQLHDFKNFINTCEQTFYIKYFDYHATQGKLFEKLALLWAVWGKEHLSTEVKEVDLEKELANYYNGNFSQCNDGTLLSEKTGTELTCHDYECIAKHFFELGFKVQNGGEV